jgi:hypothetical protein
MENQPIIARIISATKNAIFVLFFKLKDSALPSRRAENLSSVGT